MNKSTQDEETANRKAMLASMQANHALFVDGEADRGSTRVLRPSRYDPNAADPVYLSSTVIRMLQVVSEELNQAQAELQAGAQADNPAAHHQHNWGTFELMKRVRDVKEREDDLTRKGHHNTNNLRSLLHHGAASHADADKRPVASSKTAAPAGIIRKGPSALEIMRFKRQRAARLIQRGWRAYKAGTLRRFNNVPPEEVGNEEVMTEEEGEVEGEVQPQGSPGAKSRGGHTGSEGTSQYSESVYDSEYAYDPDLNDGSYCVRMGTSGVVVTELPPSRASSGGVVPPVRYMHKSRSRVRTATVSNAEEQGSEGGGNRGGRAPGRRRPRGAAHTQGPSQVDSAAMSGAGAAHLSIFGEVAEKSDRRLSIGGALQRRLSYNGSQSGRGSVAGSTVDAIADGAVLAADARSHRQSRFRPGGIGGGVSPTKGDGSPRNGAGSSTKGTGSPTRADGSPGRGDSVGATSEHGGRRMGSPVRSMFKENVGSIGTGNITGGAGSHVRGAAHSSGSKSEATANPDAAGSNSDIDGAIDAPSAAARAKAGTKGAGKKGPKAQKPSKGGKGKAGAEVARVSARREARGRPARRATSASPTPRPPMPNRHRCSMCQAEEVGVPCPHSRRHRRRSMEASEGGGAMHGSRRASDSLVYGWYGWENRASLMAQYFPTEDTGPLGQGRGWEVFAGQTQPRPHGGRRTLRPAQQPRFTAALPPRPLPHLAPASAPNLHPLPQTESQARAVLHAIAQLQRQEALLAGGPSSTSIHPASTALPATVEAWGRSQQHPPPQQQQSQAWSSSLSAPCSPRHGAQGAAIPSDAPSFTFLTAIPSAPMTVISHPTHSKPPPAHFASSPSLHALSPSFYSNSHNVPASHTRRGLARQAGQGGMATEASGPRLPLVTQSWAEGGSWMDGSLEGELSRPRLHLVPDPTVLHGTPSTQADKPEEQLSHGSLQNLLPAVPGAELAHSQRGRAKAVGSRDSPAHTLSSSLPPLAPACVQWGSTGSGQAQPGHSPQHQQHTPADPLPPLLACASAPCIGPGAAQEAPGSSLHTKHRQAGYGRRGHERLRLPQLMRGRAPLMRMQMPSGHAMMRARLVVAGLQQQQQQGVGLAGGAKVPNPLIPPLTEGNLAIAAQ